jgi:hypothetical protein
MELVENYLHSREIIENFVPEKEGFFLNWPSEMVPKDFM